MENSSDLLWEVDEQGRYTYVSPNVVSILGYEPGELLGKTPFDFMPADEARRVGEIFGQIAAECKPFSLLSHRIGYKDGRIGFMECSGTPIFDGEGRLKGYRGVDRDITRRLKAEEALRLKTEQLQQAQKMESLGRLAGGLAHEFNNLLATVCGHAELLLGEVDADSESARRIAQIKRAGERGALLTRQLLSFTRQQVLQPTTLDLNALVIDMYDMLRPIIGEHIELRTLPDPNLGCVEADTGQIEQVIVNLVINARDAMPAGGILTIETANAELDEPSAQAVGLQPGSYVLLSVADTGVGMDAETRQRIFEPFFTTKETGKGTGLGLSTIYGIVQQSGGQVTVTSKPGQGSVFRIYLPRVEATLHRPRQAPQARSLAGTETVLVVEDDDMVRDLACSVLEANGYKVWGASSGRKALELCEQCPGPIDLVVTDLVMPEMNGRELGERVLARWPATRLLYMSGYTHDVLSRHGLDKMDQPFLQKPFSIHAFLLKVREVLE